MAIFQVCRMQKLWGPRGFHPDFKGRPRKPGNVWQGQKSLQAAPERAMLEAVRVKPKLQWRPQDVGIVRNVECLSRKATGKEWSQPKREAV
jgi:hypothetical protein